jgi:transcriptional regulator with PAS, ATPase and Fis domain
MAKLSSHNWPGNVRELEHVLERGVILAGEAPLLTSQDVDFGASAN